MTVSHNTEATAAFWAQVRPLVLKVIIGAVVAAALVGVAAMIVGEFGTLHVRAVLTILIIVAFSLLAWYDAEVSSKRSHTFALVGVGVSVYLVLAGVLKLWVPALTPAEVPAAGVLGGPYTDYYHAAGAIGDFSQWIWLVIIARFALIHAHLLITIHHKYVTPLLQLTAKVTMGLIASFALLLSLPTLFDGVEFSETYWRLTGAVFILDVLGTVLIPLCYKLFGPDSSLHLTAPRTPDAPHAAWSEAPVATSGEAEEAAQTPESTAPAAAWSATPQAPVFVAEAEPLPVEEPVLLPQRATPAWQPDEQLFAEAVARPPAIGSGEPRFELPPPPPSRKLAWPRYEDGTPLPVLASGQPDFSQVERF